jgi:hypothetical protein
MLVRKKFGKVFLAASADTTDSCIKSEVGHSERYHTNCQASWMCEINVQTRVSCFSRFKRKVIPCSLSSEVTFGSAYEEL